MKRIVSFILTMALMLSFCAMPAFADYTPAENFALALNMTDAQNYVPGKTITRANFAEIIAKLCNLMDANKNYKLWQEYVYGADNNNTVITDWGGDVFADVDPSLPQYDAVMKVYKSGYMNGMTETHFGPNYDITMAEVLKVIVCMLGYGEMAEAKGGFPTGYTQVASSIKLTTGIGYAPADYATYSQVADLIYNALDIPVYEIGGINGDGIDYVKSGETFLQACLGLERAQGIMTDNGISSLYGTSAAGEGNVIVGGKKIIVENCGYAAEFLGRQVEAYYMVDSNKNHLVYACISENDDAITIDASQYSNYSGNVFSYFDENGKLCSESLSRVKLIYNGAARTTSWTNAVFSNILFGDITICSTTGNGYDVVMINDYAVGMVTKKDPNTKKIYTDDLYTGMTSVKTIDVSGENGERIIIEDAAGNALGFDDVLVGDVVSVLESDRGDFVKVVVSRDTVKDFVLASYEVSNELVLKSADAEYTLEFNSRLDAPDILTAGTAYTLYFDFMGNLVWYEAGASGATAAMKTGVLLNAVSSSNGLNSQDAVRIYTKDGKVAAFNLDKKVKLNGSSEDASAAITAIQANITDAILYETDADGLVLKSIVTPLDYLAPDPDKRGWYRVTRNVALLEANITEASWTDHVNANGYIYDINTGHMGGSFIYKKSATDIYNIPNAATAFDNEKMFSVNATTIKSTSGAHNLFVGYSKDRLSLSPEVLVTASEAGTGSAGGVRDVGEGYAFLVNKVYNTIDADGEEVTSVKGIYLTKGSSKEASYVITENTVFVSAQQNGNGAVYAVDAGVVGTIVTTPVAYDYYNSGPAEIEPGDIIRFSLSADGSFASIRLCYDHSTGNYFSSGHRNGTISGDGSFINSKNDTRVTYPAYMRGNTGKFAFSAADVSLYDDPAYAFDAARFRPIQVNSATIYIVEDIPQGVSIKKGTLEDIITYEDIGSVPNKVVLLSNSGTENYGAIIYR